MGDVTLAADASPTGWREAYQEGFSTPRTFFVSFTITGEGWGVIVRRTGSTHWLVGLDGSAIIAAERYNGSSYSALNSGLPASINIGGTHDVLVAFQEATFGRQNEIWNTVAMWINRQMYVYYTERVASLLSGNVYFGLAVKHSTTRTFSNLRIPELSEVAEMLTIDPAEKSMSALQRMISGRSLRFFMRYSGALRVFKPKAISASYSIAESDNRWYGRGIHNNFHTLKNHIRMLGAYEQAEYARADLIKKYGHHFEEENNPYLMTEAECYTEAQKAILRREEEAIEDNLSLNALHFIEPEDRITVDGTDRTLTGYSLSINAAEGRHELDLRGYGRA